MYNYNNGHVNAFIDLNGIPYLLAEYLDRNNFQQVDRSLIKSEIIVDQSDSMRAVVDISIDDIGKRASDGLPSIIGNNTKHKNLLKMISNNCELMDHQFKVLRRGIVIRVDYQLENYRTRKVIRSMTESFKIQDRNYFLDINSKDVNDNAIIVNFCNTIVSTINEFTHGRDPMMIRITNIHLSYEMVQDSPKLPRIKQSMIDCIPCSSPSIYDMDDSIYNYHKMTQNHHLMPGYNPDSFLPESPEMIMPTTWSMFNRFYRFDNTASDVIIHSQEVNDPMTKVVLIPCGTVRVNRTFMINPGHRIIFKFCIWKNDLTVVNDTTQIAQCLRAPILNNSDCSCGYDNNHICQCNTNCSEHHNSNCTDPDYEKFMDILDENKETNRRQNKAIKELSNKLLEISKTLESMKDLITPPSDDETPSEPSNPEDDEITTEELQDQIEDLDEDIENLQKEVDAIPEIIPLSIEDIRTIVEQNSIV